jgi:hypothetical protein
MDKYFQAHLFWDTIRIQNLIWSICLEMMLAIRNIRSACLNRAVEQNMLKINRSFKVGSSIRVKEGIKDPDSDLALSGWQGRILEIEKDESGHPQLLVAWDSQTLRSMPQSYLEQSELEGMDWQQFYLEIDDVEFAPIRDTRKDVNDAVAEITSWIGWYSFGEDGKRIQKVLSGAKSEWEAFEAWERYLEENLRFPFEAEVSEYQEKGRLRQGDRLKVVSITVVDDFYGIIVECRRDSRKVDFPLCDLTVKSNSKNMQLVSDYAVWFANR